MGNNEDIHDGCCYRENCDKDEKCCCFLKKEHCDGDCEWL